MLQLKTGVCYLAIVSGNSRFEFIDYVICNRAAIITVPLSDWISHLVVEVVIFKLNYQKLARGSKY